MMIASELNLYKLPIGAPSFANNPTPDMVAARNVHPWLAKSDFGIVVTEHSAVDEIMRLDDQLKMASTQIVEAMGGEGTKWAEFIHEILLSKDGVEHNQIRASVNQAFLPKAVNTYRARIQSVISELLDEWVPKGRFDFQEFASRFPVAVMFGLFAIPRERIDDVKYWLEMIGLGFSLDRTIFPQISDSFDHLWDFTEKVVTQRKLNGNPNEPDLLDALIKAQAGGALASTRLNHLILSLFSAGYDTSKNQLGQIMHLVLDRLAVWERCAVDRRYCDSVVEEALRHSGVVTSYRHVAAELEYRGITFPVGTVLVFPFSVVSRYSGPFENPMEFNPETPGARRHTGFGRGMHICLGQHLAKLQMAEGLHLMAQRLKHPRRDGEVTWRAFPGVWGPRQLPIAFDAE